MATPSEKITTVKVAHPTKPGQIMYVNSDDPGIKEGIYQIIEDEKPAPVENNSVDSDDEDEDDDYEEE